MNERTVDSSTDFAWEEWGRRDPYFGVITDPKFRRTEMSKETKREFLESGRLHVENIQDVIHRCIEPHFVPKAVLDFGCGVGRLLVPFAKIAKDVTGLDVSPSMLKESRRNCDENKLTNVRLLASDDSLSSLKGAFDLIHSCLVFQHIPRERGMHIFRKLLDHIEPGGKGALQLLYSKSAYSDTFGAGPPHTQTMNAAFVAPPPGIDPVMQMNPYNMNEILFALQQRGISRFHSQFTNHGGELGVFLFFKLDA
jgi:SAM-dependent methyltransferase